MRNSPTAVRVAAAITFASLAAAAVICSLDEGTEALFLLTTMVLAVLTVEYVSLPMPQGGRFRLVAGVAIAGIMLLDVGSVTLVYAAGTAAAIVMDQDDERLSFHILNGFRRTATTATIALLYSSVLHGVLPRPDQIGTIVPAVIAAVSFLALDVTGWIIVDRGLLGSSLPRSVSGVLQLLGGVYLGQVSVGIVLAVVYPRLGAVSVVVLVTLMLIMQHTFGLLLRVRAAYTRTVSALAKAVEMSEGERIGHCERVAASAAVIGRRLGLAGPVIERLTLAALVHDIGRISIPVGKSSLEPRILAHSGARLVSEVSFLAAVAPVVRKQYLDNQEYLDQRDTDGLLARIIRAACDYDCLLLNESGGLASSEAIVRMKQGIPNTYDPEVIAALEYAGDSGEISA